MEEIPEVNQSLHSYQYQSELKQEAQSQFYIQNVATQSSFPYAFNQSQQLFQLQENCQQSKPLCMNLIVVSQEEIEAPWRIECQYLTSLIEELERKQGSAVQKEKQIEYIVDNTLIEQIKQQLQKSQNDNFELQLQLDRQKQDLKTFQSSIRQKDNELESLRLRSQEVREKIVEKIVEKVVYDREKEEYLQSKLNSLQREYDTLHNRIYELESDRRKFELENKRILYQKEEEISQLRIQSQQVREKIVEKVVYNTEKEDLLQSKLFSLQREYESVLNRCKELEFEKQNLEYSNSRILNSISQKEEEINLLRVQVSQVKEKVVERVVYNTEREDQLQSKLYCLQKEYDALSNQYNEIELRMKQIERENQRISYNLSQKQEELSSLRIQASQVREKIVEKVVYNTEREDYLQQKLSSIQKEYDTLLSRYQELEQFKENIEFENKKLIFNLNQQEEEVKQLRIQKSQVREKVVEKIVYNTEKEDYLQSTLFSIQAEYDSLQKQYKELEQLKRQVENENQKFRYTLNQKEEELSSLRIQSSQVREKVVEKVVYNTEREEYLQSKLFQLQKEYDILSNQYNEIEQLKRQIENENQKFRYTLNQKEEELSSLRIQSSQVREKVVEKVVYNTEREDYLQSKLFQLQKEYDTLSNQYNEIEQLKRQIENENQKFRYTLNQKEEELSSLRIQSSQVREKVVEKVVYNTEREEYLQSKLFQLQKEYDTLSNQYNESLKENFTIKQELNRKDEEINSTQMKFVQIQNSNTKTWDLERQINYLQEELEKTRNQLIQIRSENQDLNMKISDIETHYYQNQTILTEQEQKIYYLQGQLKQQNSDSYLHQYGTSVMEEKINYLSQEVEIWKHKFIRANHLYNEALEDNGILRAEIESQKSAKKPFIIQSSSYQKTSQFNPLEENNYQ